MTDGTDRPRCSWSIKTAQECAYHDAEWGVPVRDSRMLWETLMLEGFQAGLAWSVILAKRENFRAAFAGFDPRAVAAFDERDIERLLGDAGIVRSRAKIEATIRGAQIYNAMADAGRISRRSAGPSRAISRCRAKASTRRRPFPKRFPGN